MTKAQIEAAAEKYICQTKFDNDNESEAGFIAGAEWALAQDGWILAEDQLPPVDPKDVDWSIGVIAYQGARREMGTANYNFRNKKWYIANFMSSDGNYVTHWMPLPTPPKK